jgi:Zn-dependent peptidase ImmA (M78 family)
MSPAGSYKDTLSKTLKGPEILRIGYTGERMFKIQTEWQSAPGVRDETLAKTWAQIRVKVGDSLITQVVDKESNSVRTGVYGPAFPLAEWIVENWWFLTNEPTRVPIIESGRRLASREEHRAWVHRHGFLAAREGNALPDLILYRDNGSVVLKWKEDPVDAGNSCPVRFIASGQAQLPPDEVERGLASFVLSVIKRIGDLKTEDAKRLRSNWNAVGASRMRENDLCRGAAQLGLDPYDEEQLTPELTRLLQTKVLSLDRNLRTDLLEAIRPDGLNDHLTWVAAALELAQRTPSVDEAAARAASVSKIKQAETAHEVGYEFARRVRNEVFGVRAEEPIDNLNERLGQRLGWSADFEVDLAPPRSGSVDGLLWQGKDRSPVLCGARLPESSQRFRLGRALFHSLSRERDRIASRLITRANTWDQRASRAFAAELLAPSGAMRRMVGGEVTADQVQDLAISFRVSTFVIGYQLENHGIAHVVVS